MYTITLKSVALDRLTEADFWQFCLDHKELHVERDADHQLTIRLATSSYLTAAATDSLLAQLTTWSQQRPLGVLRDGSLGYTLATGAMLRPAASWVAQDRWDQLFAADQQRFARICPDFVAELLASVDYLPDLMAKMEQWLDGGTQLAWLIMPATESVFIFEPGQPVRPIQGFSQELSGEPVLPGFTLELELLRMR